MIHAIGLLCHAMCITSRGEGHISQALFAKTKILLLIVHYFVFFFSHFSSAFSFSSGHLKELFRSSLPTIMLVREASDWAKFSYLEDEIVRPDPTIGWTLENSPNMKGKKCEWSSTVKVEGVQLWLLLKLIRGLETLAFIVYKSQGISSGVRGSPLSQKIKRWQGPIVVVIVKLEHCYHPAHWCPVLLLSLSCAAAICQDFIERSSGCKRHMNPLFLRSASLFL